MYYLILLSGFSAFALCAYVATALFWPERTTLSEQISFYDRSWQAAHASLKDSRPEPPGNLSAKAKAAAADVFGGARLTGFLRDRLVRSGLQIEWTEFIYYQLLGAGFAGVCGYLLGGWFFSVFAAALAGAFPVVLLEVMVARRRALFQEQLPDALTMLAGSLKTGYSLLQAVDMVAAETAPPIAVEFKKALADARLGAPVEEALEKTAQRVACAAFDWMVMAVKIQREVGGNLAEVLTILAATIRERDRLKRQIKVLTAEGRLSAIILLCLPFFVALILFLLNPAYMRLLFATTAGLAMLIIAGTLMAFGTLWLRRVIKIEV